MARYWQSVTFNGFYVEGRHQDRTIANRLSDALDGRKVSEEIMGAGYYIWLGKDSDPALRVKDLGDRTLIELMLAKRPIIPKKKSKPAPDEEVEVEVEVEGEVESEVEGEVEGEVEVKVEGEVEGEVEVKPLEEAGIAPAEAPPQRGATEELRMRVDEVLGHQYTRVETTPAEMTTKLDLKLTKWERPKPMAIVEGEPMGAAGLIETEPLTARKAGGGLGTLVAMAFAVILLTGAAIYVFTTAANDPYNIFQPGTQFGREETALGFVQPITGEFIVINVPSRHDTLWGESPRFVRADEDTIRTTSFQVTEIDILRVNRERMESVVLEPTERETETTASELDLATLQWNRSEEWEEWFQTEINRALVRGTLVRQDEALWLQAGDNFIQLELWELLSDEELLRLRWAESEGKEVLLEVRFAESLRYGRERTRSSHKLFRSEVRLIQIF